jgi:hypothetical protein
LSTFSALIFPALREAGILLEARRWVAGISYTSTFEPNRRNRPRAGLGQFQPLTNPQSGLFREALGMGSAYERSSIDFSSARRRHGRKRSAEPTGGPMNGLPQAHLKWKKEQPETAKQPQ